MSKTLSAIHGQKLYWLRATNGNLKQEMVANDLGISQQEYSDFERGKRLFTEEFIQRVCMYCKIELSEFLAPIGNGIMGDNNQNSIAGSNIQHNDLILIQSAQEAYKTALLAKDETIAVLKQLLESRK
jgi:transcriptional regulator with XRE-family HTH domain